MTAALTISKPADFEGASLDEDRIRSQLSKTLDTPFVPDEIDIYGEDRACPISLINGLRRDVLTSLEQEIISSYKRTAGAVEEDYDLTVIKPAADKTKLTMFTYPVIIMSPVLSDRT